MITTINEWKAFKLNEEFHGAPDRAELLKDGDIELANYTGILVKKNTNGKWAAFPKEGDTIFACDDRYGFTSSKLEQMVIHEINFDLKIIICDRSGIEVPVKFELSGAGTKQPNDDLIAYFKIVH